MTSKVSGIFGGIVDGDDTLGGNRPEVRAVGGATNPTASFARPANATPYASGQLVANSTTAGSVAVQALTVARNPAGSFTLSRLKLRKSGASLTNAVFRVKLYRAAPTMANGDGGVYSSSGAADYLGAFDATMDQAFTDGAAGFGVPTDGSSFSAIKLAAGTDIHWRVEARLAYTPASGEVFTVELDNTPD